MESALSTADGDLVIITLPGVQRFISEAQSTADVRAGSEIVARLAAACAEACTAAGGELVFPSALAPVVAAESGSRDGVSSVAGMPNRVVAMAPAGSGPQVARRAADEVGGLWDGWVRRAMKLSPGASTSATPGFPVVHWVCVPPTAGSYAEQWGQAREALDARRRVRDFGEVAWFGRELCSLSPRWPAEPPPPGLREHEKDRLSTASIASTPIRRSVLERLSDGQVQNAVRDLVRTARKVAVLVAGGTWGLHVLL